MAYRLVPHAPLFPQHLAVILRVAADAEELPRDDSRALRCAPPRSESRMITRTLPPVRLHTIRTLISGVREDSAGEVRVGDERAP